MNCSRIEDLLTDLLDGTLAPADERTARAHLESCPACADLVARVAALVEDLGQLDDAVPADLPERVLARVPAPAMPRTRLPAPWRKVAGFALLLTGLGWQLGGGAVAARAMGDVAPLVAEARQELALSRSRGGVARNVAGTVAQVSGVARRSWRAADSMFDPAARPAAEVSR